MSVKVTDKRGQQKRSISCKCVPSGQYFIASFAHYLNELFIRSGNVVVMARDPHTQYWADSLNFTDYTPVSVEIAIVDEEEK